MVWMNRITQEYVIGTQTSENAGYWFVTSITGSKRRLRKDTWSIV